MLLSSNSDDNLDNKKQPLASETKLSLVVYVVVKAIQDNRDKYYKLSEVVYVVVLENRWEAGVVAPGVAARAAACTQKMATTRFPTHSCLTELI